MTVAELIDYLGQFESDTLVLLSGRDVDLDRPYVALDNPELELSGPPRDPEQLTISLREWGAQHTFLDSEAEDSFDRGIGNIFWALAVESAATRSKDDAETGSSD